MVVLYIVLIAILIGVIVFLLRQFIPGLKNDDEIKDEAIQVEEEVNRMIVNPEENKKDEE